MKTIMTMITLAMLMSLNSFAQDQGRPEPSELSLVMRSMGAGFRTAFRAARTGDNSEQNLQAIEKLTLDIEKAGTLLPPGIPPEVVERIQKYQELMNELHEQSLLLFESFKVDPVDLEKAQQAVSRMNALRKEGHEIFR